MYKSKLFLVDYFRKTDALKMYQEFLKTQWLSREELFQIQWIKIKNLVNHAYNNVPYYHNLFDKMRLKPFDIRTIEDFRKIPILTKDIIRRNYNNILANNKFIFQPRKKKTGGSTGNTLRFYIDRKSHSALWAFMYRSWNIGSWNPGEKIIFLGGGSLYSSTNEFRKMIYRKLNNWLFLSAFDSNEQNMWKWIKKIKKFRAKYMYAYASSAYLFANFLENNGIRDISFKSVFTTAEVLYPKFRQVIEKVFSCEVFDTYGGVDGAGYAFECKEHNGLHIVVENSYLEILNESNNIVKDGEEGEVVSTDLYNYAMPFIRYRVGDIATFTSNSCMCGRGLPLLRNIKGRSCDFIISKNGTKVHGEYFSHLFEEVAWISQFYVVQNSKEEILIYLKIDNNYSEREFKKLRRIMKNKFADMEIKIILTEKIPMMPSGKFKFVENNMLTNINQI